MPTGDAKWIWADVDPAANWVGFFALKDFTLEQVPAGSTTLTVTADEEYVVFLNGHAIGSGRYRPGGIVDTYEVSPALVAGENRLLVELRGTHAVGGLLLSVDSGSRQIVMTDESWSVLWEYREDAKWPGMVTGEIAPVRVWGVPPTGRWGAPRTSVLRPRLPQQLLSRRPLPAARARLQGKGKWRPLPETPSAEQPLGRWVTFDFGREVAGFINIVPALRGGMRGMFWLGKHAPVNPRSRRPDGRLFAMVGQGSWTDAVPRKFRYVTVVSPSELVGARAFVLEPDLEEWLAVDGEDVRGVLGLEPPDLRSAVEDELWREFERLTSVAVAEGS